MWIVNSGACVYFGLLVHKNHMSTSEFHRTWTIVVIWKKGLTKPHMCIDFCHPYIVSGGNLVESLLFFSSTKPKISGLALSHVSWSVPVHFLWYGNTQANVIEACWSHGVFLICKSVWVRFMLSSLFKSPQIWVSQQNMAFVVNLMNS